VLELLNAIDVKRLMVTEFQNQKRVIDISFTYFLIATLACLQKVQYRM